MSDMSAKTNEAKTDKPEVTYVSGYDDPEADMILKTNDGGLFRVHSYYLKTYRSVCCIVVRLLAWLTAAVSSFALWRPRLSLDLNALIIRSI